MAYKILLQSLFDVGKTHGFFFFDSPMLFYVVIFAAQFTTCTSASYICIVCGQTVDIFISSLSLSIPLSTLRLHIVGFLRVWEQQPTQEYEKPF